MSGTFTTTLSVTTFGAEASVALAVEKSTEMDSATAPAGLSVIFSGTAYISPPAKS